MSQSRGSVQEGQLADHDEYRKLDEQHHEFERRLSALADKAVLSDDEQVEETTLKKRKLQVKDRMEAIARQLRAAHP
jgi:uncharacterized protein YdcH (DUF465 family)